MHMQAAPYSKAALRVRRQLMEAILFEKLLDVEETNKSNGDTVFTVYGRSCLFQCIGKRSAFGRIRLRQGPYRLIGERQVRLAKIEEIVNELTAEETRKQALIEELFQTIKLSDWNETKLRKTVSRRGLAYEQLEAALIEGHPYHPCFKARKGFSFDDHDRYGPEAQQSFQLVWLGVRKQDAIVHYPQDAGYFLQQELGTSVWQALVKALSEAGGQLSEYEFVPVHPWQWQALNEHLLQQAIKRRDVLYLGQFGDAYCATQSLRTVMNVEHGTKAQLKLPLNVVNTSSVRTIPPHLIAAAPAISVWLQRIIDSDPFLKDEIGVERLAEYAGVAYEPKGKQWNKAILGQIGCIWRESVSSKLRPGEQAIPMNALPLIEEDGALFIAPFIERFGIEAWLMQLFRISVIPVIHFLAEHGIALEAHGQNVILVTEKGWPKRVILRDFHESIEYKESFVKNRAWIPHFSTLHQAFQSGKTDEYYWMSSLEALRELVMDTVFVYQLTELSWQLEQHFHFSEQQFWSLVDCVIRDYAARELVPPERLQALRLAAPVIATESLLTSKVTGKENCRHLVNNELGRESRTC
ncbi:IucA/IucC family protein [Shouchella clausii]|uniref:IucA/IucC family protein n=1 Tax=Shouchella clausii TaxID=79880 RepID=UPI00280A6A6A|nr:IucA/IucC family protein [Shouchella clausii]WMM31929.1 IucA/IucC family protein [Shouchella clausii]